MNQPSGLTVSGLKSYNRALKRRVSKIKRKLGTIVRLNEQNQVLEAQFQETYKTLEQMGFGPNPIDPCKNAWSHEAKVPSDNGGVRQDEKHQGCW